MLRILKIRNFAIIDELELELHSGLNAITGETGAGKSIILDAIGLILGNRADAGLIRSGSDEATVEALFEVGQNETLERKLQAHGLRSGQGDREFVVKRTIHRNGKNKIFFDGELITLSQLADLCENLVDLCSQHEHQSLSKAVFQMDLLDRYGGLLDRRRETRELFSALRSRENELASLGGDERERARAEDFLRFQLTELEEFGPTPGEEETLTNERKRLLNATQLLDAAQQALTLLGGTDSSDSEDVQTLLGRASQKISRAAALDASLSASLEALERARVEAAEASALLGGYAESLEIDPTRLETVEQRLNRWSEMKRKYGPTVQDVIAARDRIETELGEITHRQAHVAELEKLIGSLRADYEKTARELSKRRKGVAKALRESIELELRELMMPGTTFTIELTENAKEAWGPDGCDRIQFLFSPNPGEGLKPLGKIASGGELSRVMLAIRRTIADRGGIGVYLFDEIDAGIGGQTASVVGRKLQSVAKFNQVLCITHLPQVAAFANSHYSASKKTSAGRTTSKISHLEGPARIEELARMLGGLNITDRSRAHAKDLIKQAAAPA